MARKILVGQRQHILRHVPIWGDRRARAREERLEAGVVAEVAHPSPRHERDPIQGLPGRVRRLVDRQDDGDGRAPGDVPDLFEDPERRGRVEAARRLVEEQRLRLGHELDRHGQAALLAAAEALEQDRPHDDVRANREPELVEESVGSLPRRGAADECRRGVERLLRREHADERVLLLDVRAALAARDVSGERPALARAIDAARQGIEQRGLAAAGRPEDAADLPAADGARAVVEDRLLPIGFVRHLEREALPAHLPARRLFYVDSAVRHLFDDE